MTVCWCFRQTLVSIQKRQWNSFGVIHLPFLTSEKGKPLCKIPESRDFSSHMINAVLVQPLVCLNLKRWKHSLKSSEFSVVVSEGYRGTYFFCFFFIIFGSWLTSAFCQQIHDYTSKKILLLHFICKNKTSQVHFSIINRWNMLMMTRLE